MRKTNLARLLSCRPERIFLAPFELGEIGSDLFRAAVGVGLKSALLIAGGLRVVYGGDWSIEAKTDGSFAVLARPNN
ncbi:MULTISPECIES: hypothetical protein [Bradyrhizobium]|uniref:hypothetical protein n=1 Tax=Bradyrhizobium TaxID=374 RepID=UPI0030B82EDC